MLEPKMIGSQRIEEPRTETGPSLIFMGLYYYTLGVYLIAFYLDIKFIPKVISPRELST